MASTSNHTTSLEDQFANTGIGEPRVDQIVYGAETDESELSDIQEELCLVGRFLTNRSLDFPAMQHKMASLWQPGRVVYKGA